MATNIQSTKPVLDGHPAAAASPVAERPAAAGQTAFGNTAPLALAGFAVTTLMLSLINANVFNAKTLPVVFGVGLLVGGAAQLIAGLLQFRIGDTFHGVLFSTFGAFWIALPLYLQYYSTEVPAAQAGHALALMLIAFGIFAALMLAASFRTCIATVVGVTVLTATLFELAAANYTGSADLTTAGGWMGIVLAGIAFYLCLATVCQACYGRAVVPIGPLAGK
jgi:uncharacterized protein